MRTVLVTGLAGPAAAVADALRARGVPTVCVASGTSLAAACAAIPDGSLAGYVQLPAEPPGAGVAPLPSSGDPMDEVRALIAGGLLARFDGFGIIAPLLAAGALVVLVPGDRGRAARDTLAELPELAQALTRVILDRNGAGSARLVVTGDGWPADDIAGCACDPAAYAPFIYEVEVAPQIFSGTDH